MTVQHSAITDPNLHEPKGASTATAGQVYVADGAGTGTWRKITDVDLDGISVAGDVGHFLVSDGAGGFTFEPAAHGSCYFTNISVPYVLGATTSYQKVNPTTVATGHGTLITEGTDAKLTYVGAEATHLDVVFAMSCDQASGANRDVTIALYKNGVIVAGSEIIQTTTSGNKVVGSVHSDVAMAQNDYLEVYAKISTAANINVYTFSLFCSTSGG